MYYIIENENNLYSIVEKHTEKIVLDNIKFKAFAEQFKQILENSYNKGKVDGYNSYKLLEE